MSWEFDGLFDALVDDETEDLLSLYWRAQPTSIRVGSMGYRTRTIKAGRRLEAEIYPIFGREERSRLRAARTNITPERQQAQNIRRAKRRLVLLMETNFTANEDYHVTLTYRGEQPDEARVKKDLRNFFNKLKRLREKRGLPELKYIYAIGADSESRIHVHVVLNGGIDRDEVERIWAKGYANGIIIQEYGNGMAGLAGYLYNQNERERARGNRRNMRAWSASRNLKQPKERVSDSKVSNRKVKIIAQDFRNEAKAVMEKVYPGYSFEECKVFYSDVVDGVYIRCVMRKWEDVRR